MLKHLGVNATIALAKLYNLCFSHGIWVWDTSDVIFLKKDGKNTYNEPGSYRPISLSSYIGKIFEKILVLRFENYLHGQGLIDTSQEGFTKGKNTVRYLNRLTFNIKRDMEKKLVVSCLFIDFEKAFDSVWKKGLISKMMDIGVYGKFLALIDSFLMNRKAQRRFVGFRIVAFASARNTFALYSKKLSHFVRKYGQPISQTLSRALRNYFSSLAKFINTRKQTTAIKIVKYGPMNILRVSKHKW